MSIGNNTKYAPKTTSVQLLDTRSKAANKNKLKNYTSKTTKHSEMCSNKKLKSQFVANTPRVGVQAKNSSIISKNNSSYSDKRYESTKVDERDSVNRMLFLM